MPAAVWLRGRRHAVEAVLESWHIDDEWWRQRPVSWVYYSLLLEDGIVVTMYCDVADKGIGAAKYTNEGRG